MAEKIVCQNRKARHTYNIEETFEAGIALRGPEVKSLREGRANINEAFARIVNGEVYLYNAHISPYPHAHDVALLDPTRTRKLLLHRHEIRRLLGKVKERGYTLVPLKIYFNPRGLAKVELALAKGKKLHDRRETIRRREEERDLRRRYKGKIK
ncbi:SsrA-binding protein SmpB [Thermosulfuriphilus ammonigenes]|uniref:SsrA-binding protein n=1 Tax=Thermosulfuriphilus ammonigenes TaxID=1936021 RepID=A0A6G7PUQ0_9BACT|nr:SsrA-binding protein SmpB [Thermosulfuriphilus ammonigenes]MBA2848431.1 SsrA-binding protein [Thermosulfuriphilus ammonigenes]QIJ71414.1 SsrA-binding protein SmpB [Thermosulfuriphilus ammonigenes]